jgi:hypothetical protein
MSVSCVACFQTEVSASGLSLVLSSPIECDRYASIMRRLWPPRSCCSMVRDDATIHKHHGIIHCALRIGVPKGAGLEVQPPPPLRNSEAEPNSEIRGK